MDKLARIAHTEAVKKSVDLKKYNGIFAVNFKSKSDADRKITDVRFTPFKCNEMGLDGGGFDVEVDPITFNVIDSYISEL